MIGNGVSELGVESLPYGRVELDRDTLATEAVGEIGQRSRYGCGIAEPRFVGDCDPQGNPFPTERGNDRWRIGIGVDHEPGRTVQLTHVSISHPAPKNATGPPG